MRYNVRAIGPQGIVSVVVDADDADAARDEVTRRALRPLQATAVRGVVHGGRRKPFALTLFSQELLALLEAGLTLTEAIEALHDKEARTGSNVVLGRLLADLQQGLRFSTALARQPEHFPPLYVGLMQAAERTSNLPQSLGRYIEYRGRLDVVRNRLVSALAYPAVLALVGGAVIAFLLGYVVPRFAGIYQGTGRELPWLSQQLIAWGERVSRHWQWLATTTLLGLAALWIHGRAWWRGGGPQRLARHIPGVANTLITFELARLYLSLGTLLDGGLPILQALRLGEGLLCAETRVRYRAVGAAIAEGASVSSAFEAAGLATPVALRLLRVGERGGRLGEMLGRAARFHDGEIARGIELFARTFEPLLMAAIGLVVGAIVVLLYLPIFDLAGSLQ